MHVQGCYGCEELLVCPRHAPSTDDEAKASFVVNCSPARGASEKSMPVVSTKKRRAAS
jgi:hypothetical protein